MPYLYLNFADRLEKGTNFQGRTDIFGESLVKQFEDIQRRFSLDCDFPTFAKTVFSPVTPKTYHVFLSGFNRKVSEDKGGKKINNIVIRANTDDETLRRYIPREYDLILIGDLYLGSPVSITIKSLEIIDSGTLKTGELDLPNCLVASAFGKKTITLRDGKSFIGLDYNVTDLKDSILSNDDVVRLSNLLPISQNAYKKAANYLKKWEDYIKFRNYYLSAQGGKLVEFASVKACDSYMITRDAYRANSGRYENHLLAGLKKDVNTREQIVITQNAPEAEAFPLIEVDIERNLKELMSDMEGGERRKQPKFESYLKRFTRQDIGLTNGKRVPRFKEDTNPQPRISMTFGDRYLFTYEDIEPDVTDIENKYDSQLTRAKREIDAHYNNLINSQVMDFIKEQEKSLNESIEKQIEAYATALRATLEKDVSENKVQSIRDRHKHLVKKDKIEDEDEQKKLLRSLYEERNESLISGKRNELNVEKDRKILNLSKTKQNELTNYYKAQIEKDKRDKENELLPLKDQEIAKRKEEQTYRLYRIYFRPEDALDTYSVIKSKIEKAEAKYLMPDQRAEKAKIDRERNALEAFRDGNIRNPYLIPYLFSPEKLPNIYSDDDEEPDWNLESLNDTQKLAVKKALKSESIFLLQGPPGTGKTQVIAEITAQLARQGKKVLISSETHKAIDNVFERLPKTPEIRPLRLIPSSNAKTTDYSIENLVENFYKNIVGRVDKQIRRYENFQETKEKFSEDMKKLRLDYGRLLDLKRSNQETENEINSLNRQMDEARYHLEDLRASLSDLKSDSNALSLIIKSIEAHDYGSEYVTSEYRDSLNKEVGELFAKYESFKGIEVDKVRAVMRLDPEEVKEEVNSLLDQTDALALEARAEELRNKMRALIDPITLDAPEKGAPGYEEYSSYRKELIEISAKIKEADSNFIVSDSDLLSLFSSLGSNPELLRSLPADLPIVQREVKRIERNIILTIDDKVTAINREIDDRNAKINDSQIRISEIKTHVSELKGKQEMGEAEALEVSLKKRIETFFKDFDIFAEYDKDDLNDAFRVMDNEWERLSNEQKKNSSHNEERVPIYKKIKKYLSKGDILEDDARNYTKSLMDCVNVFGITCTSRDSFSTTQLAALGQYGIDSVDIKGEGIDVVIVDEVSKSSFLDLLIPILYGKTVILVGDHRQLPPMYDLRNLRENEFEGLDPSIITYEKNKDFTELYEECFFKTLYEKVPSDYKVMLRKQYRCHSHIMEVFNHFYGGSVNGLTVGKAQQDNEKEHGLTVFINKQSIIEPRHHVIFVDCEGKEASEDGSTSKVNYEEADVVVALLKAINASSQDLKRQGKFKIDKDRDIDERPSVGVIATYGDQAGLIKKKTKKVNFADFSGKSDERFIVSTVDDFQGDERDIIILSMVRNPVSKIFNADFITKFERINVALSRARKLLIVAGNRKFLSEKGVIDLPDIEGRQALDKNNFHVYREIIDTIAYRGRILDAKDILGE